MSTQVTVGHWPLQPYRQNNLGGERTPFEPPGAGVGEYSKCHKPSTTLYRLI